MAQLEGGGRTKFRPPYLTPAWSWVWTIFYQILSMKKMIPKYFFGASCIISTRISNYFLVFDWKKSVVLNLPSQKTCLYVTSLEYYMRLHKTWQPKKNNEKYNKDYIRLLELLQTIRGKQGKSLTGKQGQRDFDQKDYYGQTKYSQLLTGTT